MKNSIFKRELLKVYNKAYDFKTKSVDWFLRKKMGVPKIMSVDDTLDYIMNNKCSVARFGDGELKLAVGEDISFQRWSPSIEKRLCQILKSNTPNCLITLSEFFEGGKWMKDDSREFIWRRAAHYRVPWTNVIDLNKLYGNTAISRFYYDWRDKSNCARWIKRLKIIWDNDNLVIIEGEKSRLGYNNDLFDNSNSIRRILCPKTEAFDYYDEILSKSLSVIKPDDLILIALGPTATILAYDLSQNGYRALDIGHVDIEYEWFKQGATQKVKIENKYTNEAVDGKVVGDIFDEDFNKQVVLRIGC